jgi:hypothetical protein
MYQGLSKEIYFFDKGVRFDAEITGFSYEKGYIITFKTGNDKRYPFSFIEHEQISSNPVKYNYYIKNL